MLTNNQGYDLRYTVFCRPYLHMTRDTIRGFEFEKKSENAQAASPCRRARAITAIAISAAPRWLR